MFYLATSDVFLFLCCHAKYEKRRTRLTGVLQFKDLCNSEKQYVIKHSFIYFLGDSVCSSEPRSTGNTLQDFCSPPQVSFTHIHPLTSTALHVKAVHHRTTSSKMTIQLNCHFFFTVSK